MACEEAGGTEWVPLVDADAVVNEPDDAPLDWDQVNWRSVERDVLRLRRRIFAAERAGDSVRVASLQKLMLRGRSNVLVSVRRVTELNAGRVTAGIDGKVVLTSPDRAELAEYLHHDTSPWQARPVKRIYIPKSDGNAGRWGFLSSRIVPSKIGCAMRWNLSGRHALSRDPMDSGQGEDAMTRSEPSIRSPRGKTLSECGFWTRT